MTPASEDEGVTLVELIIYLAVGALILALMAGLLINGLKSQAQTTDRDTATARSTIVTNSLQTSIRNATAFKVETNGLTVRAVVVTGAATWQCRAWSVSGGNLMYKTSSTVIPVTSTAGWTTLAPGVAVTAPATTAFTAVGNQLSAAFTVTAGAAAVPVTTGVVAQATLGGAGPCW